MKLSIITVCYNSKATIRDTFDSILSQIYAEFEYIVIDGGSKDTTVEIIKEYEPKFHGRMKWISEPDRGLYDAMNKGIRMATGDVIGILHSDDFFTSNDILKKIVDNYSEDLDCLYGDIHYVKDGDLKKIIRYYSSEIFNRNRMKFGFIPAHPSCYIRKSCFEKYGYYKTNYKIAADFELLLRFIYVHQIHIQYLPLDMVTMRLGGASTENIKVHRKIMSEHLRAFHENGIHSNCLFLCLRYVYKISELIKHKKRNQ